MLKTHGDNNEKLPWSTGNCTALESRSPEALSDYNGTDKGDLTIAGELNNNKLASNAALGRNFAGVHFRSDGDQGLAIGVRPQVSAQLVHAREVRWDDHKNHRRITARTICDCGLDSKTGTAACAQSSVRLMKSGSCFGYCFLLIKLDDINAADAVPTRPFSSSLLAMGGTFNFQLRAGGATAATAVAPGK
eukprot:scaffold16867_cov67-Phaeocystis_antarctica.AAC.1